VGAQRVEGSAFVLCSVNPHENGCPEPALSAVEGSPAFGTWESNEPKPTTVILVTL
jgi:hypothetical protein